MSGFSARIPGVLKGFDASGLWATAGKRSKTFADKVGSKPFVAGMNAIGGNGFRKTVRSRKCNDLVRYDAKLAAENTKGWSNLPTISDRMASFGKEVLDNPWDSLKKYHSYLSPLAQAVAPTVEAYRSLSKVRDIVKDPHTKGMRGKAVTAQVLSAAASSAVAAGLFSTGLTEEKVEYITKKANSSEEETKEKRREINHKMQEIEIDLYEKSMEGTLCYDEARQKMAELNRLKLDYNKLNISDYKSQKSANAEKQDHITKLQNIAFKNLVGNTACQIFSLSADKITSDVKKKARLKKAETEKKEIIDNPEVFLKKFDGNLPQILGSVSEDEEIQKALINHIQNKREMFNKSNIESTLEKFEGNLQDLSDYVLPDHELFDHILQYLPSFPSLAVKFGLDID